MALSDQHVAHSMLARFFLPNFHSEYLPNLSSEWNFIITELETFVKESSLSNQILQKGSQSAMKFNFIRRTGAMKQ